MDEFIDSDFNPDIFDLNTKDFKPFSNIIDWVMGKEGLKLTPYPRQFQIFLGMFEDYCPYCSDMDLVKDMWGVPPEEIIRRTAILQFGVCPHCNRNKRDFRQAGLIYDKHELVGVAGQRCLHPDFKVVRYDGSAIPLRDVTAGTWLRRAGKDKELPAIVKEVIGSVQPGYFKIWLQGLPDPVICSDEHLWPVVGLHNRRIPQEIRPAVALRKGDWLSCGDLPCGFRVINKIEKVHTTMNMVDLEIHDHVLFEAENGLDMHNSGKTAIAGMIATYITHRYLTLPKMPYEMFGLAPTTLRATFVATSKGQASETLWQNVKDMKGTCKWFQDYETHLTEEGNKYGQEFFKEMDTYIAYRNMKLALTFEAADPARLRGRTRYMAALDELGLFPSGDAYVGSGQECYTSLNNALITVRAASRKLIERGEIDPPKGWMLSVSSPIAEDDPIMPLLEVAKADMKMYAFHHATWEINPNITKDDLKSEMLKDANKFWRDWGAQPPSALDAFISKPEMLEAIVGQRRNAAVYTLGRVSQEVAGQIYHYRVVKVQSTQPHDNCFPRVLAVDAGETDNSYSFAIGYFDFETNKTVAEVLVEIEPEVTANGDLVSVSFERAVDVFKALKDPFKLFMFCADRWNSTSTIEQMRDAGLISFKHSPTLEEFKLFRSRIFGGEAELPARDCDMAIKHASIEYPVARCIQQARTVKEVGRRLTKPNVGSDDVFRAWALLDIVVYNNKEDLKKQWEKNKRGTSKRGIFAEGMPRRIRSGSVSQGAGGMRQSGSSVANSSMVRRVTKPNNR